MRGFIGGKASSEQALQALVQQLGDCRISEEE
jgi:hypothetical protein